MIIFVLGIEKLPDCEGVIVECCHMICVPLLCFAHLMGYMYPQVSSFLPFLLCFHFMLFFLLGYLCLDLCSIKNAHFSNNYDGLTGVETMEKDD